MSLRFPSTGPGAGGEGGGGQQNVERTLHAMRGDAAKAPDLTAGILLRMEQSRPFADARTLRLRRWGRIVGASTAVGVAVCVGVVVAQWTQIAPAITGKAPSAGPLAAAVAGVKSGSRTIKDMPTRLASLVRIETGPRTDPEDVAVVRAVTKEVIVPMGAALRVTPSLEATDAEVALAERLLSSGQRVIDQAERLASSIRAGGGGSGGQGGLPESETFADRFGRAVSGGRAFDGGPR
ncbi:MAG: hypothetical protein QM783_13900 [Phycisphaerales bacterium]